MRKLKVYGGGDQSRGHISVRPGHPGAGTPLGRGRRTAAMSRENARSAAHSGKSISQMFRDDAAARAKPLALTSKTTRTLQDILADKTKPVLRGPPGSGAESSGGGSAGWDEAKHPRRPKGARGGGEFRNK